MAKKVKAQVTFTMKDKSEKVTRNVEATVEANGSVVFPMKLGRIVPGTDVAIVIDGKTFTGKATSRPVGADSIEVMLPAGTVPATAVG